MAAIKAFISYSWSSAEHAEWVLHLATELRQAGIDAILDKWDLKEGHEANAFMEKMVSDPEITKVIIVSDSVYVEKSNTRKGGAGTEAQIISGEIFAKQDQDKFVVAVAEIDENGKPCIPAYYTSRIYIDFSDESKFTESFEQLLRWIADRPIYVKPELGTLPKYISDPDEAVTLATGAAKRRAIDGLINNKTFSYPATKEYFEIVVREVEKFRLPSEPDPLSNEFLANFESFMPYRDELLDVVRAIANYTHEEKFGELIHAFFEDFSRFFYPPDGVNSYGEFDFDNFRFFGHELFLHVAATLLSAARYDIFNLLAERPYYSEYRSDRGDDVMKSFVQFRSYLRSLELRKEALKLNRISIAADMLRERSSHSAQEFRSLMQVDFVLFLRADLFHKDEYERWWPETLAFLGHGNRTFEIFERSRSTRYFEMIRPILGNANKEALENLLERYHSNSLSLPYREHISISPAALIGIQKLCSLP